MNGEDWLFGVFLGPLMIIAMWFICYLVWRRGENVSSAVDWFTGEGGVPGYHAFLLPATLSMTTGWIAALLSVLHDELGSLPEWAEDVTNYAAAACVVFLLVGFWLWATKWPRFLLPPQFRPSSEA